MGNCLRKRSDGEWGGDDWGSFCDNRNSNQYPTSAVDDYDGDQLSSSAAEGTEVKIKISKKQLEQLVKTAEVEGLSAQEVLAKLINGGDEVEANQRSWKPALQSIPE